MPISLPYSWQSFNVMPDTFARFNHFSSIIEFNRTMFALHIDLDHSAHGLRKMANIWWAIVALSFVRIHPGCKSLEMNIEFQKTIEFRFVQESHTFHLPTGVIIRIRINLHVSRLEVTSREFLIAKKKINQSQNNGNVNETQMIYCSSFSITLARSRYHISSEH